MKRDDEDGGEDGGKDADDDGEGDDDGDGDTDRREFVAASLRCRVEA